MTLGKNKFHRQDLYQLLPLREHIRSRLPSGCDGFVAEDLDLVIRHFGARYGTDGKGRLMLIEQKHGTAGIGVAQQKTFGLMDELMRRGDSEGRYLGYYVLNVSGFSDDHEPLFPVTVNGRELNRDQFHEWLKGELSIKPLFR